ncbi:MAG: hypothetical protein KUA43_01410 [Hoeflea sp.]|uniref:hypothetical protein n=1 Tax=Hoeflea sp. TaxID=1940281 RepID=UPI001D81C336|nr:hypothetical protein [Hoeflea sp.]MBU4530493.1 hypothetical protein [Alphaproteobacteria bacterium]MBU4545280.1 hypothetical protein [Alphaproteobacteria bacterium]MBU4548929.1 hypothetical protein [Alphaproteobacteria bacterium]MBV1722084.1 hypothetical protein [Hoeflea sp.]MBV1761434.1 hypothetical protein [Hoeflea sp.]
MSGKPNGTDQTLTLLKIQGLLAGAYDLSRHTDNKFLSYLIKMARMELKSSFDPPGSAVDELDNPDNIDRI